MSMFIDQFPEEKDSAGLPAMLFVVLIVLLLVPFAGMYLFADTLNPFDLRGPPFLAFYGVLSMIAYGIGIALRIAGLTRLKSAYSYTDRKAIPELAVARWLIRAVILLGIARLVRGIYLGRPVIFLCLILFAHAFLSSIFMKSLDQQSGEGV